MSVENRRRQSGQRLGITGKLFLAVLATAAVVTVAMGASAHWNIERLFIGYLNEQAIERMEAALPRVRQAHAQHGNWDFVRGRPDRWFEMLGVGPPRPGDAPPTAQALELMGSDQLGAGRRVSLLDEQRQHVMGFPQMLAGTQQREIVVDGRGVGWLAIAPVNTLTGAAALRLRGQLDAALATGALALRLLQTEVSTLSQLVHDLHELALADAGALSYCGVGYRFDAA